MTSIDQPTWDQIRSQLRAALTSCLHCAIASVNPDGTPHVTPIGSVMLRRTPGRAVYFDVFNARLSRNLERNPNVCMLAVDGRKWVWLRSLVRGRFATPPGVQLIGVAGVRRHATRKEIEGFRRLVKPALHTIGGRKLWAHLEYARDVEFSDVRALKVGPMTPRASSR